MRETTRTEMDERKEEIEVNGMIIRGYNLSTFSFCVLSRFLLHLIPYIFVCLASLLSLSVFNCKIHKQRREIHDREWSKQASIPSLPFIPSHQSILLSLSLLLCVIDRDQGPLCLCVQYMYRESLLRGEREREPVTNEPEMQYSLPLALCTVVVAKDVEDVQTGSNSEQRRNRTDSLNKMKCEIERREGEKRENNLIVGGSEV